MSFKRSRDQSEAQISPNPSRSATPSPSQTPTLKAQRLASKSIHSTGPPPLLCTLPPTCHPPHHLPTALHDARELERHYATYHAHVCAEPTCGAVFPDARLLELHHTECHDPLAMVRKERGEKIFACHLAACPKLFLDPKKRRLHLIQAHGYPKEYFFAVTNKGVGGLLKRWGEGASLLRKPWKARDGHEEMQDSEEMEAETTEQTESEDEGSVKRDDEVAEDGAHVRSTLTTVTTATNFRGKSPDKELEKLSETLGTLSLVPPSIHFGRAKPGRMERRSQAKRSNPLSTSRMDEPPPPSRDEDPTINIDAALQALKEETSELSTPSHKQDCPSVGRQNGPSILGQGRGRGGRGRGRARGVPRGRGTIVPP